MSIWCIDLVQYCTPTLVHVLVSQAGYCYSGFHQWTLFITRSRLLFYFLFRTRSICFRTIYRLQMVLGVQAFLNFSYFNVLYKSYRVNNKVIDVLYILMYYYTGILFVVLREGWVSYTSLFAGNLPWRTRTIMYSFQSTVVFIILYENNN